MKIALLFVLIAWSAAAQTNSAGLPHQPEVISNILTQAAPAGTNQLTSEQVEAVRMHCIENRRLICGRVMRILPGGLVINSGYTNLTRPPLGSRSWVIPGTVEVGTAANSVEAQVPNALCIGQIFLTDPPRVPRFQPKLKLYDYVVLEAYPTGKYTYTSVGEVQHTVRRFSAKLATSVQWNLGLGEKK